MAALTGNTGIQDQAAGAQSVSMVLDRQAAGLVSELNARYSQLSRSGRLFSATALLTAPVIFSTAAGTGGPLLWNPPGSGVIAQVIAVGFGVTVASTVAAAIGLTGGTGQNVAPTATTAIDTQTNMLMGGAASKINAFRVGTVATAGGFLVPLANLDTGALTTLLEGVNWIDVGGILTFGPGSWASLAASATATTAQLAASIVWAELPV